MSNSDADLIRVCAEHVSNMTAYNTNSGPMRLEGCPLWKAYERTRDTISAARPKTLAGMQAVARAAKAEARTLTGKEDSKNELAQRWVWGLVDGLLAVSSERRAGEQFIRISEVVKMTAYSSSEIYRMISKGEFPEQRMIGARSTAWLRSEVDAWIASRPKASEVRAAAVSAACISRGRWTQADH